MHVCHICTGTFRPSPHMGSWALPFTTAKALFGTAAILRGGDKLQKCKWTLDKGTSFSSFSCMGPRQLRVQCPFAHLLFPNSNSKLQPYRKYMQPYRKYAIWGCEVRTPHRGACAMSRQWLQGGDDRPSWATLTRRARGRAVQHDVLSDSVAGCSLRLSMPSLQATANAAMRSLQC